MARKRIQQPSNQGAQSSLMTIFASLSTLILTFFVFLISMSSLNDKALRVALHNFDSTSGILFFREKEAIVLPKDVILVDIIKSFGDVRVIDVKDIDEELSSIDSTKNLILYGQQKLYKSFSFIFNYELLFESGSANLSPKIYPILDRFAAFLKDSRYMVFISGHTDNVPPSPTSPYSSNEELSIDRAMAVSTYLLEKSKVPPSKIAIAGYADLLPIADNNTPQGRALNRRVELIFRPMTSDRQNERNNISNH